MQRLRWFIVLLAAWWLPFVAEAAKVRRYPGDPLGVVEARLDNGLTVLLSENHNQPEVFGAVVVRVGSKNDPHDHTGMAHYLEHMLFKGTTELGTTDAAAERPHLQRIEALYEQLRTVDDDEARAAIMRKIDAEAQRAGRYAIPNELDRLLAEIGSTEVNAFTTPDFTVYYDRFAASQIETWLAIYAHRFENPVFRMFPSELEAVYEEKNISMDGFMDAALEAFLRSFFPDHRYRSPTLGTVEHLKRPSLTAMREHFDRYYVANNMALVLSGDFDAEAMLPIIEARFGGWPNKPLPKDSVGVIAPLRGRETATVRVTPVRAAALAWRTPPRGAADTPALMVLRELLSNEQRSGVVDRLVDEGHLLFAEVLPVELVETDAVVILYAPKFLHSFARAERTVQRRIDEFRRGTLGERRIAAARRNVLRQLQERWEDNEDRALALADAFARGRDGSLWGRYVWIIDAVAKIDGAAVRKAATRYLDADVLALRSRVGFPKRMQLRKPGFTAVEPPPGARSEFYRSLHPLPAKPATPRFIDFARDLQRIDVAPGVVLQTSPNPVNRLFSLELHFGLGQLDEPALVRLAPYLERVGSTRRGASGFKQALYDHATTFSAWTTEDELVLALEGPDDSLPRALTLLAELLQEPARDPRRLRRIRQEAWAEERLERGDPGQVSRALWQYAVFGEHSEHVRYGRRALRRYDVDDLLAAFERARARALEVRYIGNRSTDDVAKLLRSTLPLDAARRPAVVQRARPRLRHDRPRVYWVKRRDAVQTHAWFFVDGEPLPAPDAVAAEAFAQYMGGGMGGIVFQEIREIRALAYSTFANWNEPSHRGERGFFYAYLGSQADKTPEALAAMHGLIRAFPRRPARVAALRSALQRSQETTAPSFRDVHDQVDAWRRQGYVRDPRPDRIAAYPGLELADIERFWRTQVAARPVVLVVVADPRKVKRSTLERFGDVVVVPEHRLYAPD